MMKQYYLHLQSSFAFQTWKKTYRFGTAFFRWTIPSKTHGTLDTLKKTLFLHDYKLRKVSWICAWSYWLHHLDVKTVISAWLECSQCFIRRVDERWKRNGNHTLSVHKKHVSCWNVNLISHGTLEHVKLWGYGEAPHQCSIVKLIKKNEVHIKISACKVDRVNNGKFFSIFRRELSDDDFSPTAQKHSSSSAPSHLYVRRAEV